MSQPERNRRRTGFTFVTLVAFMGTLALGVAIVQTDAAMMTMRRAAVAAGRSRARVASASLSAAIRPEGSATLELPGVSVSAEPGSVTAQVMVKGRPVQVASPR